MKISVCMGIYNGERYISEQLSTIMNQTRKLDEVILCDDGSTDRTVDIATEFIKSNKLGEKWKLYRNPQNLGYPANYYHAMELCTGDIVFLSDQDDIWHEVKIERMSRVFEDRTDIKTLCCKFALIDADGKNINTAMAPVKSHETAILRPVTIDDVFYKCEWPGMVTAYRQEWYKSWSRDNYSMPHDFLLCARAAEENGFAQMDECLAYHRRHNNNTGGEEHRISRLLNKKRKLKEIEDYLEILNKFETEKAMQTTHGKQALQRKTDVMHDRYAALQTGKITKVVKNAWKNRKNTRLATAVCDILIAGKCL